MISTLLSRSDAHPVEKKLQHLASSVVGQVVEAVAHLLGPGDDVLHQDALLGQRRLLTAVLVQSGPERLQPLRDEPALDGPSWSSVIFPDT